MNPAEHERLKDKLFATLETDPEFKARLKATPKDVLREFGFDVPDDVEVQVAEETKKTWVVYIPYQSSELSDAQLEAVAGGKETVYHKPCFCTW